MGFVHQLDGALNEIINVSEFIIISFLFIKYFFRQTLNFYFYSYININLNKNIDRFPRNMS